jgi:hypothetical protein
MTTTVFDVLIGKIEEDISSAKEFLSNGSPKDYSEYREVCGLIRGLASAQKTVKDLSRNFEERDDD